MALQDKDRIFTNIYGLHDKSLKGAKKRGHWSGTQLALNGRSCQSLSVQMVVRLIL